MASGTFNKPYPFDPNIGIVDKGLPYYTGDLNSLVGAFITARYQDPATHTPKSEGLSGSSAGLLLSNSTNNYGIQLSLNQADGAYIRIKSGGTWGGWTVVGQKVQRLTTTYTTNSHITSTNFAGIYAFKKNGMLFLHVNAVFSQSSTGSTFVEIGRITGWSASSNTYVTATQQASTFHDVMLQVGTTGIISVYSDTGLVNAYVRCSLCTPENN